MIFVSVFDHWLTQSEFEPEIHTDDPTELDLRRKKLTAFVSDLCKITPTYFWKYKRQSRFHIYPVASLKQLLIKCNIRNQNGFSGQGYDILLPELNAVYSEEWDWTNIIWYREKKKIEPLIDLANKAGLHILEKQKN